RLGELRVPERVVPLRHPTRREVGIAVGVRGARRVGRRLGDYRAGQPGPRGHGADRSAEHSRLLADDDGGAGGFFLASGISTTVSRLMTTGATHHDGRYSARSDI